MAEVATYSIYSTCIKQLMQETQHLPSLPSLTLKIRSTLTSENVNHQQLGELISQDASLCVWIMREVQSPVYLTAEKPKTLFDAIRLLGLENLGRIVTLHGLKSLFVFQRPKLQQLFDRAWQRQLFKASICRVLATKLGYRPIEEAVVTSMLTEVGTLAILSALTDAEEIPSQTTYLRLCREYSKSLGAIVLRKWEIDDHYYQALTHSGNWHYHTPYQQGVPGLSEVVNLALYHSVTLRTRNPSLPPLAELPMYQHLPSEMRRLDRRGLLCIVTEDLQSILDDTKRML
ncbi:MAG: hypothetical protein AseanaTS_10410 [Candidatus Pelagadaptatus aseana]|uniref:HDOD domain-containing protein n=1 Tax=Candidatus Pelagadaptatus aseana TaxID=3120508 RepID=UPI0039B32684